MSRSAILHLNTDTNTNNTFLNTSSTSFSAALHGTPLHLNPQSRNLHHLPTSQQQSSSISSSQNNVGTKNQINHLKSVNQSRNSHLHLVQDLISANSTIKIKTPQKNPLGSSSGGAPATGVVALRKSSLTGSTDFSETVILSNGNSNTNNNNNNAQNKISTLNFYSTMPLSRTRSLLANINGVAGGGGGNNVSNGGGSGSTGSGGPGSAGSGNGSSSSSANTPNEQINGITNGFSSSYLPSITTNGTGDHILPPLKSTPLKTNNSGSVINSSSAGGILFNGVAAINSTNASISNGYSGTNTNNSTSNNSSITNRDYSITNGHNNISNHHSNHHHYNNHHHNNHGSHHGLSNGAMNNKDLDAISTNSVIMSSVSSNIQPTQNSSLTNGISSSNSGSNSNSNGFHMNGMQTLPLVRHNSHNPSSGGGASNNDSNDRLQQNGTSGGSVAMDASPKHGIQITTVGGGNSSSTTSTNAINSNIASSVIGGSNNSNNQVNGTISGTNSANTGSLKPKTMVATPEQVMKLYMNKLTPYEHHEIFSYPQIYFIGANAKKRPGIIGGPNNCGYDDDQGSYTHIAHDHLAYRYEVLKVIGKGSFGQVVKAYDHKSHHHVALKMVRNEKRFHRQAQEEIRILEHLRKQDKDNTFNIIHMYDHFTFRSHTCITFELLSINLYELIKKNKFQGFSLQLVRKFAHSLLQCLDLLFRNKIIHCDMKPENVLLKQQGRSGIKVRNNFSFSNTI